MPPPAASTPREVDDGDPTVPIPASGPAPPTVLQRLGGPWGIVTSTAPQVAFAVLTTHLPFPTTVAASFAIALVLGAAARFFGASWTVASGGVVGVLIAGAIALWTGSASNYFLVGIVTALGAFVVNAGSVVVRRPLTGMAWNALHGGGHPWRDDRPTLRAHDVATAAAALVAAARFVVLQWLYVLDAGTALAFTRVALGLPLTAVVAVAVVWAFRRSTRRLLSGRESPP